MKSTISKKHFLVLESNSSPLHFFSSEIEKYFPAKLLLVRKSREKKLKIVVYYSVEEVFSSDMRFSDVNLSMQQHISGRRDF